MLATFIYSHVSVELDNSLAKYCQIELFLVRERPLYCFAINIACERIYTINLQFVNLCKMLYFHQKP